jgi:L-threonylcarbamoyladenylate synthase
MIVSKDIKVVSEALKKGELVAIPTETVYGLAANIYDEKAIHQIYSLKKRPKSNPLIVHIGNCDQLDLLVKNVPKEVASLIQAFWPGPLTLLLEKSDLVPSYITAGSDKVAVRMPNHTLVLELLNLIDFPLAAPSANPYKRISPTEVNHVVNYFEHDLNYILDGGKCEVGVKSTILGFEKGEPIIYRLGGISKEKIESVLKREVNVSGSKSVNLPGSAKKHYSPLKRMIVTENINKEVLANYPKRIAVIQFSDELLFEDVAIKFSFQGDFDNASKNLFSYLHFLDQQDIDLIICERFPANDLGLTLNDRVERASVE